MKILTNLTVQFSGSIINPFYAGFVTGRLVGGKLIKGLHPPLVDIKTFMRVQDILNDNPIAGVPKVSRHDEVPLKTFACDETSRKPFTGYKTKGIWYYKTKDGPTPVNVNAKYLNGAFTSMLSQYEYKPQLRKKIEAAMSAKLKQRLAGVAREAAQIKKKIAEKKALLEKIEHKFITDQISDDIYQKHSEKIRTEIAALSKETDMSQIDGSNLELAVSKCLTIAQNLSQAWVSAEYEQKQRLQKLVFPEGILYGKQKGVVRTPRVNSLFEAIPLLAVDSSKKKKADPSKNRLQSNKVPRTGIEPALRCRNQILSLARLPIPPSGRWIANIGFSANIFTNLHHLAPDLTLTNFDIYITRMLTIGLLREGKVPADNRVALTPDQCKWIHKHMPEYRVVVQVSPNRCFSDREYHSAGVELLEDMDECDILLGIKEVPISTLISGKTYLFFSHTRKQQSHNQELFRIILDKGITLIDYECLEHEDGTRIIGFGFFAGIVGAHNGIMAYGTRTGEFKLGRVYQQRSFRELIHTYFGLKLPNIKIVVTGSGRVAHGILEIMNLMGIREVEPDEFLSRSFEYPVYVQLKGQDLYARKDGQPYRRADFHEHPEAFESRFLPYAFQADILMNGVYWE